MSLSVAIVRITAAVFVLYGVGFLFAPDVLSVAVMGTAPATPSSLIDMRATYGGMSLAVGVLLFVLAARPESVDRGLMGVALLLSGMAGGRAYGMVVAGSADGMMSIYLGFEVTVTLIALYALVRHRRQTPSR